MEQFYIPFLIVLTFIAIKASSLITPPQRSLERTDFMSVSQTTLYKGTAILLIMIGHCTGYFVGGRYMTPCGGIGVSIFLIASGYGLNESFKRQGLKKFWRKRLLRVWIPYVIITLLLALYDKKSVELLLEHLLLFKCHYWFVTYIVGCYILFFITSKWFVKYRMTIMTITAVFSLLYMPELQAEQALGFVTGIWMSQHIGYCRSVSLNHRKILTIALLLLAIGIMMLGIKQLPVVREYEGLWIYHVIQLLIKWPLSMGIILGLFLIPNAEYNPFLAFSGMISYELYLVHFRFYGYIENSLLIALIVILGSYIASYGFNKLNSHIVKLIA